MHIVLTVKYDRGVKDGKKKRKSNSNAIKKNQIRRQICKIQRKAIEASLAWQIKQAHAGFFRQACRFCYNRPRPVFLSEDILRIFFVRNSPDFMRNM